MMKHVYAEKPAIAVELVMAASAPLEKAGIPLHEAGIEKSDGLAVLVTYQWLKLLEASVAEDFIICRAKGIFELLPKDGRLVIIPKEGKQAEYSLLRQKFVEEQESVCLALGEAYKHCCLE